jgi:hypothetical protein
VNLADKDIFHVQRPWSDFVYDVFVGNDWVASARQYDAGDEVADDVLYRRVVDAAPAIGVLELFELWSHDRADALARLATLSEHELETEAQHFASYLSACCADQLKGKRLSSTAVLRVWQRMLAEAEQPPAGPPYALLAA